MGPARTIIFHEPALASVFAGVTAGKTSVERMSLLQLEPAERDHQEDCGGEGSADEAGL